MAKEKKIVKKNNKEKNAEPKKSLWVKFRIFCHGVKSEFTKVHWTSKKDLIKYSIATVAFILFTGVFFYVINILFALVQSLF